MSNNNKRYEQAISRVLSEHVEQQVPDSTDLWPLIERRLSGRADEREGAVEDLLLPPVSRLPMRTGAAKTQTGPPVFRSGRLITGLAAILLLAALSTLAFSLLAKRQE